MTAGDARLHAEQTPGTHDEPSPGRKSKKRPPRAIGVAVAVAGLGLILDQGTKALATAQLPTGGRVPLIGDLLALSLVYNPGAAFSIGSGTTWVFTIVGVLAAAVVIGFAARMRGPRWGIVLGLVLGGAVGNLLDRLVNPPSFGQGQVTDFIAYGDLFVGNVADILLVLGVALLCLILITQKPHPASSMKESTDSAPFTDRADRRDSVITPNERED